MLLKKLILGGGLLVLASLFGASVAQAQTYHVRAGATGSGNGSDWNNAYPSLPATLQRGATYYLADGSYAGYIFDDVESGTSLITIKKATLAAHGTSTGWQSTYGDGQSVFNGDFIMQRDYYTIDGQTRNEDLWNDDTRYGFRIRSIHGQNSTFPPGGDHITVQYASLGGNYSESYYSGMSEAVYCGGFAGSFHNWTISRCFMHNSTHTIVQFAGVYEMVVEYCFIGPGWGKEAIRGQINCNNNIIRHNVFYNASQRDPEDSTSGITAEIAIWNGSNLNNNEIYGNTFHNSKSGGRNAVIVVGGNGSSWVGPGATGTKVYNNTFAGIAEAGVFGEILLNGSGNEAKNNLFYACARSSVSASSTANNVTATINPFVDFNGRDFRITSSSQARNAGSALSALFAIDRLGVTRGSDGVWDVGAFEYVASNPNLTANAGPDLQATLPTSSVTLVGSYVNLLGGLVSLSWSKVSGPGTVSFLSPSLATTTATLSSAGTYTLRLTTTVLLVSVSDDVTVTILDAPDTTAPTASLTAPTAGGIVSNTVTLSATASDNTGGSGVANVSFLVDGAVAGSDASSPYSFNWDSRAVANGSHVIQARAVDGEGNQAGSASVTVSVQNVIDTTAPSVALTAPAAGSTISATVTLSATATDNVGGSGVAGVTFLVDGVAVGAEDTTAPYSISWNPATTTVGAHSVTARTRDVAGNQATSSAVSINVTSGSSSTGLNVGDRVAVNSDPSLRVRSSAAIAGTVVGDQLNGALGTIVGGPVNADGYRWWQINYDSSVDGWSIEGTGSTMWLVPASATAPAPPTGLRVIATVN